MKQIVFPLIAVAIFISLVGILSNRGFSFKNSSLDTNSYSTIEIADKKLEVEVANTNEDRKKGLSDRDSLDEGSGMLFAFGQENVTPSFWMKNMKFSIDIIWIDDDTVVGFVKDVKPQGGVGDNGLNLYTPEVKIDYVLEVNSGFVEKNNISPGDPVKITFKNN